MVGVKTWTDDGIWFVLLASKILSPSSAKKIKPGRFFTDEAIGLLCKKMLRICDMHQMQRALDMLVLRNRKVLEIIERLRGSISQAQDSTIENMLDNSRDGTTASQRRSHSRSSSNTSANTMSPMSMSSPLTQSQPRRSGNWNRSEARQFNPNRLQTMSMSANGPFDKSYGRGHENNFLPATTNQQHQQHGRGSLGTGSHQQQPRQVHSATTRSNPLWYLGAENSSSRRQTMGNVQGMDAYMQNGGSIPGNSQHTSSGSMYQSYGNQMGPDTAQIQFYGHAMPMDPSYATNYENYAQGLPGLGINGMPMPTGPADVGSSSYPYDTPSYGQFNAGMMPQNQHFDGETSSQTGLPYNQYSPQQQYSIEYPFPSSNIDFDGMEIMPQRPHGLSQATMNDSNFANFSSLGLAKSIFSSPSDMSGSSNGFIESLDNQSKSNDLENQGGFSHQARFMSQEPQQSISAEKGKKRSIDEAEISDINFDGYCERQKKKHNSEDNVCSRQPKSNGQNARYEQGLSEPQTDDTQEFFIAASSGSPIDSSAIALDITPGAVVVAGVGSAAHSSDEAESSPISTNLTADLDHSTNTRVNDSPHRMPNLKSQEILYESVEIFPHQEDGPASRNSNGTEDSLSEEDFLGLSDHFDDIYYELSTSFHEISDEVIQADHVYLIDQM
ncbi:uncharacterized protein EAF01_002327 [Botrytis porri]|uniref:uncharacterized protein n=1 Tax=Botrytis porri TaxID=87229 RepID=UPI0018FF2033|nr:uncharacterized protein EAF01_002327 [Botrytis porri]KAF7910818.1 hypothetical protein EAF01_002327 [Botrytis porri]